MAQSYTKSGPGRSHKNGRIARMRTAFTQMGDTAKLGDFWDWIHYGNIPMPTLVAEGKFVTINFAPIFFPFRKKHLGKPTKIRTTPVPIARTPTVVEKAKSFLKLKPAK